MIYRNVQQQAAMLSYVEVFHILMWAVIVLLPLLWFLRTADATRA